MKQETMYPTQVEVINAIEAWRLGSAQDYRIETVEIMGDSIRRFYVTLVGPNTMKLSMSIMPGANVKGWFASDVTVFNVGDFDYEHSLRPYPENLQRLMNAFPHNAIVSLDNEDDAYPVGHPVFGYAAIDEARNIIGFAAHDKADFDGEDYTYNPFLPRDEVVTDEHIMETLTDTESPRIRDMWVDDIKEWWA